MQPHLDRLGEIRIADDDRGRFAADHAAENDKPRAHAVLQRHARLSRDLERAHGAVPESGHRIRLQRHRGGLDAIPAARLAFDRKNRRQTVRKLAQAQRRLHRGVRRHKAAVKGKARIGRDRPHQSGVGIGRQCQRDAGIGLDPQFARARGGQRERGLRRRAEPAEGR